MKKHVLQWHITHRCNLRCSHCYQEDYANEMTLPDMEKIFYDYLDFVRSHEVRGHINFTGGEPLLSPFLYPLLDLCEANDISFGILTNGTLLDDETVKKLGSYKKLSFIQISIDGVPRTHDKIRGVGNFDKSMAAFKRLRKAGIETMAAFTCHKENYTELKAVIRLMRRNKVDRFWADRLIPMGSNKEMILETEEYKSVIELLTKEAGKWSKTKVHLNRSLQFLEGGDCYYHCSAGRDLLTILADGTLLPCRRLPISIGNVKEKSITELVKNSDLIKDLTDNPIPDACMSCVKAGKCEGGAKCLTYALTGDYHGKDVNCYYRI